MLKYTALGQAITLGRALADLARDHSDWSQATFGTDSERGPIGAIRHLQKEAREAETAAVVVAATWPDSELAPLRTADLQEELADCLLLLLDANRRAGFSLPNLIDAAAAKMVKNKARTWPAPLAGDLPTEHVKEL
jgi:hypothetical protein